MYNTYFDIFPPSSSSFFMWLSTNCAWSWQRSIGAVACYVSICTNDRFGLSFDVALEIKMLNRPKWISIWKLIWNFNSNWNGMSSPHILAEWNGCLPNDGCVNWTALSICQPKLKLPNTERPICVCSVHSSHIFVYLCLHLSTHAWSSSRFLVSRFSYTRIFVLFWVVAVVFIPISRPAIGVFRCFRLYSHAVSFLM